MSSTLNQMLERLGLADKSHLGPPQHLSLGQQQCRLAWARVFLGMPEFSITDDRFVSPDREVHEDTVTLTKPLIREYAPSLQIVTHDHGEVKGLAHHTLVLRGAPATLGEVVR